MKTFLRLTCVLAVALSLFCTSAILFGRIMPESIILPELEGCKPKICFLGIVSGETSRVDAEKILVQTPGLTREELYSDVMTTWQIPSGTISSITLFDTDANQYEVILAIRETSALTVADIIHHWGLPCAVSSISDRGTDTLLTVRYPDKFFSILQTDSTITPNSVPTSVGFNVNRYSYCLNMYGPSYHFYTWHGFGHYMPQ